MRQQYTKNRMLRLFAGLCLTLVFAACAPAPESAQEATRSGAADTQVYQWKMIPTWPKNLPGLGAAPERLADRLRVMSNGRLDIKVYGAGELVGALEVFDAVSQAPLRWVMVQPTIGAAKIPRQLCSRRCRLV
jgi:TRAP-type mannitol/chloroaromatic compound transport system substrate-binding protein